MSNAPGQPRDPFGEGPDDASYWWMDSETSGVSRPSDARVKLERLRHDVHNAPDLSARILGQAGRHDVFVTRSTRRAIRAMRWGGAAAAAMLLALTLFLIYRTPAGEAVRPSGPTPVTDLVSDIRVDARALRDNVLEIPELVRSSNRIALRNADDDLSPKATRTRVVLATTPDASPDFSPTLANTWTQGTFLVARYNVNDAVNPPAPLGLTSLADALDAIADALETHDALVQHREGLLINARFGTTLNTGVDAHPAQAGFFASDPDGR